MRKLCIIGEADPFIARLLKRFAEESGLRTLFAKNGRELYELVERENPQLLIVDVELPGTIRGWQAVVALRERSEFIHLPIITCSWLQEAEVRALIGEVSGNLKKPELHFADFLTALKAANVKPEGKSP